MNHILIHILWHLLEVFGYVAQGCKPFERKIGLFDDFFVSVPLLCLLIAISMKSSSVKGCKWQSVHWCHQESYLWSFLLQVILSDSHLYQLHSYRSHQEWVSCNCGLLKTTISTSWHWLSQSSCPLPPLNSLKTFAIV